MKIRSPGGTYRIVFRAANGTLFIGSRTAGANGDVTNFTIPGNITMYSVVKPYGFRWKAMETHRPGTGYLCRPDHSGHGCKS